MTRKKTSPIWSLGKGELQRMVDESESAAHLYRRIHNTSRVSGQGYKRMKQRLAELGIDASALVRRGRTRANNINNKKTPLKEILVVGSTYNRYHLKNRLIEEGVLDNKCLW